jgi:glutamyl-tRNA synthetase
MKKIVTRFAPSPTGYLHLGGLRTALYSWLWARKNNGTFILRLEDTDQGRFVEGAEEKLKAVLHQLGLDHDEYYKQSDRLDLYRATAEELISKGLAYRCNCTSERLDEMRKKQSEAKQAPKYDGHCRELNLAAEGQYVVRFKIPADQTVTYQDTIRGEMKLATSELDDFVLLKSDGWPTYHLAMLVDDHAMGITHVIRAEEWLPSLPKHALLYDAMGWERPEFVHLPLLLNPDKSKLSKRQGDVAVEDYLTKGYLPAALINYVSLLGWHAADDREFFSLEELKAQFSLERLQKSGAVFDVEKLNWYNSHYIRQAVEQNIPAYYQEVLAFVRENVLPDVEESLLERIIKVYSARLEYLMLLKERSSYIFSLSDYPAEMLVFKKSTKDATTKGLTAAIKALTEVNVTRWISVEQLETLLKEVATTEGLSFGDVLWPVRVALSGVEQSPSPAELAWILGREETLRRLESASKKL